MKGHGGHIHPPGHFCGSNCPMRKPRESSAANRQEFRKGDKVTLILRGAGGESSEASEVLYVRNGEAWLDNGPGNDPGGPYDPVTGKSMADEFFGFTTRIEHA